MIRFLAPLLAFGLLLAGCGDNSADTRPRAERTPQTAAAQPPARTQPPGQVAFTLRDTTATSAPPTNGSAGNRSSSISGAPGAARAAAKSPTW